MVDDMFSSKVTRITARFNSWPSLDSIESGGHETSLHSDSRTTSLLGRAASSPCVCASCCFDEMGSTNRGLQVSGPWIWDCQSLSWPQLSQLNFASPRLRTASYRTSLLNIGSKPLSMLPHGQCAAERGCDSRAHPRIISIFSMLLRHLQIRMLD